MKSCNNLIQPDKPTNGTIVSRQRCDIIELMRCAKQLAIAGKNKRAYESFKKALKQARVLSGDDRNKAVLLIVSEMAGVRTKSGTYPFLNEAVHVFKSANPDLERLLEHHELLGLLNPKVPGANPFIGKLSNDCALQ